VQPPSLGDVAYAAGFFDGEGWISIGKQGRAAHNLYLIIGVAQKNLSPLLWVQARWGGSMYYAKSSGVTQLTMSGGRGSRFLQDVLPFLQVKRAAALVALQFHSLMGKEKRGRGHPLPPAAIKERLSLKAVLQALNRSNGVTDIAP
jgi:hypothetical protein